MTIAAQPHHWPRRARFDASRTVLLVIDMQWDFCHHDGYVGRMQMPIEPLRRPIPVIADLLDAARSAGVQVIFTRQGFRADYSDIARDRRRELLRGDGIVGSPGPLGRCLIRGEPGNEIIPELAPLENETIVDKSANSAFHATDLDLILRSANIEQLILCGNTLDVCVHSTLRSADDRGYECLVVADACGCAQEQIASAALEMVRSEDGVFGCTATAAQVLAVLSPA